MQITRFYKLELFSLIFRGYGTQRCHNYYEILEVSPNCSQKEIRSAFIALSKKFHPDIMGEKGHDKFVILQEAYNILSKEHTRREYDMTLKYKTRSSFSSNTYRSTKHNPYHVYKSRREWEERMARGQWEPYDRNINRKGQKSINYQLLMYAAFGVICVICQLLMVNQGTTRINLIRTKYQRDFKERQENDERLRREKMNFKKKNTRLTEEEQSKTEFNDK
ncbi:PREDICTED: dnaJ homolog subfamily C member 4-like [Polistes dominula]|uniref:DnaJ homolog subfamily C member 4-like n=1 Tax=Polistes dominula TaxID=743375 RepID=A0ABM1I9P9_POLDO|nr:PREDICTED: dnaJ homolog subfamily C member 4-like [Polistes dominula]